MKNVLVISYFFPPLGGPGVQRTAKFVKYLPEFGWNPIVISVKNIEYIAYDKTLLADIRKATIHRTESLDLMRILYHFEKIRKTKKQRIYETANSVVRNTLREIFPIDPKIGWLPFAVKKGVEICRTRKIEVIFSTILPYTSALVGYHIAQKCNLPLVLDYRDLWEGKPDITYFSRWHHAFSKKWEHKILQKSAHVIMNTNRAKEIIQSNFPDIPSARFSVLYNGFDKEDFANVKSKTKRSGITFTYTGSFSGGQTPLYFVQAMKELWQEKKLPDDIRFQFIGNFVREIQDIFNELPTQIDVIPQVSHQESIEYLLSADVLLFFVAKEKSEMVIPAKLFEYLAAQKMILAMVPPNGEAAVLMNQLEAGFVMEIDDIDMIKKKILHLYELAKEGKVELHLSEDKMNQLERKNQAEQLARILDVNAKK